MLFGEIIEPSTRALIDDETEEYPEFSEPLIKWNRNFEVPQHINQLIFVETDKPKRLFKKVVLDQIELLYSLNNGNVDIYKVRDEDYIVLFTEKSLTTGEIVGVLVDWLQKATHVYCITSAPLATYQNAGLDDKPEYLVRKLPSANSDHFKFTKLESPNLVSGLGAQVLSFCIHNGLKCILFIIYMNTAPLDSINAHPICLLIDELKLPLTKLTNYLGPQPNNLYL